MVIPFHDPNEAIGGSDVLERLGASLADSRASAETLLAQKETADLLARAVSGLTREHRRILILRYQDDLTFSEIAQQLGVTEVSAHQMHSRALARLKQSCARLGLDSYQQAA